MVRERVQRLRLRLQAGETAEANVAALRHVPLPFVEGLPAPTQPAHVRRLVRRGQAPTATRRRWGAVHRGAKQFVR